MVTSRAEGLLGVVPDLWGFWLHATHYWQNRKQAGSKHAPQAQMGALFGQVPQYCFYENWRFSTVQIPVSCLTKILATSVLLTQYLNHTWSQRLAAYHASPGFLQRQVSTCVKFPPQAALHIKTLHMYFLLWINLDQGCLVCFFFYCCSPKPLPYVIWQWGGLMQVILPSTADVGFGLMAEKVVHQPGFGINDGFSQF